ncbi:Mg2+ transporter protein, CorA-like protein [Bacillus salipaludis]|uniref:Magnesium transporter CorA family protein n=1 Tax=Bacillus salipaludis TaxID=2547811 RepID=A0A4R5VXH4_9BACI|nr:magnesium transporter CorA family protein [Bacillus salipaludis]MDQ6595140.1 magnesium transporter CorA family protein [Bacillus salipaludis]TDK64002.1 Mg2+ transporter protein, CorA-like protein [Bacillus salipaludis]
MEKVLGENKWKWIQLNKCEIERGAMEGLQSEWLERVRKNKSNCLRVEVLENGEKAMHASLIYQQSFKEEQDNKIFHFYLTNEKWVTVDLEWSTFPLKEMDKSETAVDGFLLFLGELLNEMLGEVDQFEESLKTLIWSVRKRNETRILELLYRQRHELLVWKNLLIPIKELIMAIEEVNLHKGGNEEIYFCSSKRMERAFALLNEYEHELDSMINLEEVISSHRGNEIMKTLTVITTIFTPIMAFGALWGMNFKHMPELGWKYGYLFSIIITIVSTLLLYGYLKIKGWTGDLLKGKRKGSFFK